MTDKAGVNWLPQVALKEKQIEDLWLYILNLRLMNCWKCTRSLIGVKAGELLEKEGLKRETKQVYDLTVET